MTYPVDVRVVVPDIQKSPSSVRPTFSDLVSVSKVWSFPSTSSFHGILGGYWLRTLRCSVSRASRDDVSRGPLTTIGLFVTVVCSFQMSERVDSLHRTTGKERRTRDVLVCMSSTILDLLLPRPYH